VERVAQKAKNLSTGTEGVTPKHARRNNLGILSAAPEETSETNRFKKNRPGKKQDSMARNVQVKIGACDTKERLTRDVP